MKKLTKILLSSLLFSALAAFALTGCKSGGSSGGAYDVHDYFEGSVFEQMLSSTPPTEYRIASFVTKQDVVITKITGTAVYNYEFYNATQKAEIDHYADEVFTTDLYENNVTIERNGAKTFDFVLTPASSKNAKHFKLKSKYTAGETIVLTAIPNDCTPFPVYNLKIEFKPA